MKKLALAGFVVFTFVLYTVYQRHESDVKIGPPAAISRLGSSPSPTASPADTGTASNGAGSTGPTPSTATAGAYRNGQFTGSVADAYYGNVQVQATISGGKITKVNFLQYPNDRSTSRAINSQAIPYLQQEAIQAQSAQVDIVSGATDTSQAFIESLGAALSQAKS